VIILGFCFIIIRLKFEVFKGKGSIDIKFLIKVFNFNPLSTKGGTPEVLRYVAQILSCLMYFNSLCFRTKDLNIDMLQLMIS